MEGTLKKKMVLNVLYTAQNALFPLILAMYLSRVLGPEGVGTLAGTRNLVSYFAGISLLGIPAYGAREMAKDPMGRGEIFRELAQIQAILGGIATVVYGMLVLPGRQREEIYKVLTLEVLLSMGNWEWIYRGQEKYGSLLGKALVEKGLIFGLSVGFVHGEGDLGRYCRILCLGNAVGQLWVFARVKRCGWLVSGMGKKEWGHPNWRKHGHAVAALMFCGGAASLHSKVDITMLGRLGTAEELGYYVNAYKVVNIVAAMACATSAVCLPQLSRSYGKNPSAYQKTVCRGLKMVLFWALPCALGLAMVAGKLVTVLFGGEFALAAPVLEVLSLGVLVRGVGDMLCYQPLISAGKETNVAAGYLLATGVNLLLNRLLIPGWGAVGAAWATVLGELAGNAAMFVSARKIVKVNVDRWFLGSLGMGLGTMALAVWKVGWAENTVWGLLAGMFAGAVAYLGSAGTALWAKEWKERRHGNTDGNRGTGSGTTGRGNLAGKVEDPAGDGEHRGGSLGAESAAPETGL